MWWRPLGESDGTFRGWQQVVQEDVGVGGTEEKATWPTQNSANRRSGGGWPDEASLIGLGGLALGGPNVERQLSKGLTSLSKCLFIINSVIKLK